MRPSGIVRSIADRFVCTAHGFLDSFFELSSCSGFEGKNGLVSLPQESQTAASVRPRGPRAPAGSSAASRQPRRRGLMETTDW